MAISGFDQAQIAPPPRPEDPVFRPDLGARVGAGGGMGVSRDGTSGVDGNDIASAAGVLKSILGSAGTALGSRELQQAAIALGGVRGIQQLVSYFQSGMPGGVPGGINASGGVLALISAALGQIAQSSGNADLGKAAQAAGAAANAASLAGTGAAVTSAISSGLSVGLGTGASFAAAPVAGMMLAMDIMNMIEPGSAPNVMGDLLTGGKSDPWMTFGAELGQSMTQGRKGLDTLRAALPYVQSKEELGQLLNTYKNYVATTKDWQIGNQFGSTDPYQIGRFPEAGGSKHEGGITASFGDYINQLQQKSDQLYSVLPGDPITGLYGQPGGSLTGDASQRLWGQFMNPSTLGQARMVNELNKTPANMQSSGWYGPIYAGPDKPYLTGQESTITGYEPQHQIDEGGQMSELIPISSPESGYTREAVSTGQKSGTISRFPTYDPATGQLVLTQSTGPKPPQSSDYFQQSPYWQQLMSGQQAPAPGTEEFRQEMMNTIGITGGMRAGIGQPAGAFGGQRSPSLGGQTAAVDPSITKGIGTKTGATAQGGKV